jgi:hypothetical protein
LVPGLVYWSMFTKIIETHSHEKEIKSLNFVIKWWFLAIFPVDRRS